MPRERNLLIGVLPIACLLQFDVIANVIVTPCPAKCYCDQSSRWTAGIGLKIKCPPRVHNRPDPQQLYKQLDSILSNVNSSLDSLAINWSPLAHVPRSLCRLTTLKVLDISWNNLADLPNNCFIDFHVLGTLNASSNNIPDLPNGVFNGMSQLTHLDLSNNKIADLPNGVFNDIGRLHFLDLSHNKITGLPNGVFDGIHYLRTLILTSNQIASISRETFSSKSHIYISSIYLADNQLTSPEPWWHDVNITAYSMHIGKNPWDCSCDNKWMTGWLKSIAFRINDLSDVQCYIPPRLHAKAIVEMSDEEFCVDPAVEATKRTWIISMSSVAGVVIVLLSVGVVVYRLRVKLYTRWKFHPFDRDECLGEDMDYDVFLCCSSKDDEPQERRMVETLEAQGYSVCYHYRDFMPGLIVESIEASVTRSKRTLCLLTGNFVRRFVEIFSITAFSVSSFSFVCFAFACRIFAARRHA